MVDQGPADPGVGAAALARVAADLDGVAARTAAEATRLRRAGGEAEQLAALDRAAEDAARVASRVRQAQLKAGQARLFDGGLDGS